MRILIPTAGEESAREIAEYVMEIAQRMAAEVTILHILREGESDEVGIQSCLVFTNAANEFGVTAASRITPACASARGAKRTLRGKFGRPERS